MNEHAGLLGLFVSAFTSATILPGTSEIVVVALVAAAPERWPGVLAVATLGNTLGGLTTYAIGRLLPQPRTTPAALRLAQRWGVYALLLSWVPWIGDALCLASGWLRHAPVAAAALMALGKAVRYGVVIAATLSMAG